MATTLKQRIGLRIKSYREEAGLTQENLAGLVERTPETISNIERGKTLPSIATLEQIGDQLRRSMRDFFDQEMGEKKSTRRRLELELKLRGLAADLTDVDLEIACEQIDALIRKGRKKSNRLS